MPLELPVIRTFFPWNDIGTSTTAVPHVSAPLRERQCFALCLSSPHFTPVKARKRDISKEDSCTTELFLTASNHRVQKSLGHSLRTSPNKSLIFSLTHKLEVK
jgi:hypothetical protein